jgi:hypothetical protein
VQSQNQVTGCLKSSVSLSNEAILINVKAFFNPKINWYEKDLHFASSYTYEYVGYGTKMDERLWKCK